MSRSLKKGPYIEPKLEKRVIAQNEGGKKSVIKTWSRASMISPDSWGRPSPSTTGTSSSRFM